MLQSADSQTYKISETGETRAQWMALLARAPVDLLEQALGEQVHQTPQWLRKPETGLMMIEARAGVLVRDLILERSVSHDAL